MSQAPAGQSVLCCPWIEYLRQQGKQRTDTQACWRARCWSPLVRSSNLKSLRCRKLPFVPSQRKGCASCGPAGFFGSMAFAAAPSADSELKSTGLAQARRCNVPARIVMTSFRLASRQHLLQLCFASLWAACNQTWLVEGHGQHQSKRSCFGARFAHSAYEDCQLLSAAGKADAVTGEVQLQEPSRTKASPFVLKR